MQQENRNSNSSPGSSGWRQTSTDSGSRRRNNASWRSRRTSGGRRSIWRPFRSPQPPLPTTEELAAVLRGARLSPYLDIRTPAMYAQLRVSRVPFRFKDVKLARLDVVQVKTSALFRARGVFGRFLERLTTVANKSKKIVFIESVIGPELLRYIHKRPYDFYLVPRSENNYVYLPSVREVSPETYRSLMVEAQARMIEEARRRQDAAERARFQFYTF